MSTPVVWHPACRLHQAGAGHPERPERVAAVLDALRAPALAVSVEWVEGTPASREALERVHQPRYLDALEALASRGGGALAPDTAGVPRATYVRDVLAAVGAALDGWRPDVVLVSAGFDSLAGDPLGGFTLEPEDLAQCATELRRRAAPAPVIAVLEGGYRLDRLAAGAAAVVRALA